MTYQKIFLSDDYRRSMFELTLLGSDGVVLAYGDLMKHFFKMNKMQQDHRKTLRLWGLLRLEIRKDLGNKTTKLDEISLLRPEITDIEKLEKK